jgi:hypothetical protein
MRSDRKEGKYPKEERKKECNEINRETPVSQIELGWQRWLAADPLECDAVNGDQVRS